MAVIDGRVVLLSLPSVKPKFKDKDELRRAEAWRARVPKSGRDDDGDGQEQVCTYVHPTLPSRNHRSRKVLH